MANLPERVRQMAEFTLVEDLMLAVLRDAFPDVEVRSQVNQNMPRPTIVARRQDYPGYWTGDERFVDVARLKVDTFADDPDGDTDAGLLAEAVRVAIRDAAQHPKVYPGLGHITFSEMIFAPTRTPDWATASGPVQYADLPSGVWRYEAEYDIEFRPWRPAIFTIP